MALTMTYRKRIKEKKESQEPIEETLLKRV